MIAPRAQSTSGIGQAAPVVGSNKNKNNQTKNLNKNKNKNTNKNQNVQPSKSINEDKGIALKTSVTLSSPAPYLTFSADECTPEPQPTLLWGLATVSPVSPIKHLMLHGRPRPFCPPRWRYAGPCIACEEKPRSVQKSPQSWTLLKQSV